MDKREKLDRISELQKRLIRSLNELNATWGELCKTDFINTYNRNDIIDEVWRAKHWAERAESDLNDAFWAVMKEDSKEAK